MKKALFITSILPLAFIIFLIAGKKHKNTSKVTVAAISNSRGCKEIITAQALSCNCGGGFVFINSSNQRLLPSYPLPHNEQLIDGQQYRANYVINDPFEVVIDCFDLGCAAQGYMTDFKCLQKLK